MTRVKNLIPCFLAFWSISGYFNPYLPFKFLIFYHSCIYAYNRILQLIADKIILCISTMQNEVNQQITITNVHIMSSEFIHYVTLLCTQLYLHHYVHSYPSSGFIMQKISDMLNKNSLGLLKKGVAKIKRIIWHLRWLVSARADISAGPSQSVRPKTDIKLQSSTLVRTRTDIKLQPIGLVRSCKDLYKNKCTCKSH